jgi:outer membrane receptor for ferric coprogen and ferric-rhodotorulic acid
LSGQCASSDGAKFNPIMNTVRSTLASCLTALAAAGLGIPETCNAQDSEKVVLSPFQVKAQSDSLYSADQTNTGTLIAKLRDEIPFVTSVLKSSLVADLNLNNPADFATQFAGVARGPLDQSLNDGAQLTSGTSFTSGAFRPSRFSTASRPARSMSAPKASNASR